MRSITQTSETKERPMAGAAGAVDSRWDAQGSGAHPTPERPAILRGGAHGLVIVVDGQAAPEAIAQAVADRLAEAPGFFRGNDVRIRVERGPLAPGCLARLDELAARFDLRIVDVSAQRETESAPIRQAGVASAAVTPACAGTEAWSDGNVIEPAATPPAAAFSDGAVAEPTPGTSAKVSGDALPGSSPQPQPVSPQTAAPEIPSVVASSDPNLVPVQQAQPSQAQPSQAPPQGQPSPSLNVPEARIVLGPVRSGALLEHVGHVVIFGDVNPGAEVRATGNIIVLGRMRGTAHAGIDRPDPIGGFILALRLEPQQLRIGPRVARAGEGDKPGASPELAHVVNGSIVVEDYPGRLPSDLAASI